jgi:hypothetical protein
LKIESISRGLDPQVRKLCREAVNAINRYPVKDPLAFATPDEDDEEDEDDEGIMEQAGIKEDLDRAIDRSDDTSVL